MSVYSKMTHSLLIQLSVARFGDSGGHLIQLPAILSHMTHMYIVIYNQVTWLALNIKDHMLMPMLCLIIYFTNTPNYVI